MPFFLIMADNIYCVIIAENLEVPVIRGKPAIKNFSNLNFSRSHGDIFWGFLSPISTIAIYFNLHNTPRPLKNTPFRSLRLSAQFLCQAQIVILEILNIFLRLKLSPSLNLNKIGHFSKVSLHDYQCEPLTPSCFTIHRKARIYDKTEQTKIVEIPQLIAI